jgi:putative membrane protein
MILLFLLGGILTGTITGLIPGLHSNNVAIIMAPISLFGENALVFVLSMIITQSFVDFIPAIFFAAPETSTFEGVLPGHRMFLQGKGFEAITLTVFGGVIAVPIGILCLPIFNLFLEINKDRFLVIIPIVLIITIIILAFSEKSKEKVLLTLFILFATATQGYFFTEQIFPLIAGYFGVATIIHSVKNPPAKKVQETTVQVKTNYVIDALQGILGGAIVSIIPGIGSNVAAAIIKTFKQKIKPKNYLVLVGSINTSNLFFSFPVLFILNKARNGGMILLNEKIFFTSQSFFLGIVIMFLSCGFGAIITLVIAKKVSSFHIDSKKIGILVIIFLITSIFAFNGVIGLVALFFSTATGLFVTVHKIKRSSCLGALIIPALFYYLFILI